MNIQNTINKLLIVLGNKGEFYKINSFLFYSEKTNKYCKKYQILKKEIVKVFNEDTEEFENIEKYKTKKECYNKIDILKYLVKENKEVSK